ncbi:hypothetical protein SSPSH_003443 [Salinisphaera shabanensis E1L3A]|uniref:Uncharacterized protein n=1 Tax=Salinisphaera shabanensis E1L3A TaxID=1033802 RepID=U2FNJ2_9GAMM|nr:hypothetical protein SSPSH_003443 [Salinisphaera shabanensis E1L3A]
MGPDRRGWKGDSDIPEVTPLFRCHMSFGTHEFAETLVSRCSATHFRLLVQTKVGKGKDTRVTRRRAARRTTAMLEPKRCGKNSHRFRDAQTPCRTGAVRRTPFGPALLVRSTRCLNTGGLARSPEPLQLRTKPPPVVALRRITPWLIRRTKLVTLSERQRRLPVLGPLGVAPSSGGRTRTKRAGCLSEASFRHARVRPEPRRESARSADARQGALLLVTSLGQAREVTRTAVRNPKPEFARVVDSDALIEQRSFRTQAFIKPAASSHRA